MKSILLIMSANIKRRKIQTLLVAICIALAALMFSTLIGIGLGMERPFEKLYSKLKASHIMMQYDINVHNPNDIKTWFEQQEEVVSVSTPSPARFFSKKMIFKGEELKLFVQFREHRGNEQIQDRVDIIEGEVKNFPGPGEIWIPNHWRNSTDLELSDTIHIPTSDGLFPLVISGVVVDAHHANGLNSPTPAWMGPGGLSLIYPINELSYVTQGVRLKDADQTEDVWSRFNQEFSFQGVSSLYKSFKQVFQIVYQITGGLILVFAIFGIIVTLIITSSVVNSAIKSDYKMIGMLKAQGFTNRNVITVYVLQFLLITCVAVPFGLIGGYFMTHLVFKSLITAIGAVNFDVSLLMPSIATFFAFLAGILLISYRTSLQASKIQPVTAIRNGGPPQKSFAGTKLGLFKLRPKSNLVVFLGLRFIMSNKKRAFFLFIGLLFVVFVQLLYVNGEESLGAFDHNRPAWGFEESDITVRQQDFFDDNQDDYFKEDMEDDDRVKTIIKRGFYGATIPATEGKAPESLFGLVFDDDLDKVGLYPSEGRHPVFEEEISLGVTTSQELGLGVGDSIELFLEGQLVPYSITGIYQGLNNLGKGFHMRLEGITEINPLYKIRSYQIKLKKGESIEDFKSELESTYGSAYTYEKTLDDLDVLKGIFKGIQDVMGIISLLFLGVLFIAVFNDTVLSIREGQRDMGIYKALGMTPLQLQMALITKAVIISFYALIIGAPLSLYIIPRALGKLTTSTGLSDFPYVFDGNYSLMVIPFVLLITIVSVYIGSRRLLKIRPRILVRE